MTGDTVVLRKAVLEFFNIFPNSMIRTFPNLKKVLRSQFILILARTISPPEFEYVPIIQAAVGSITTSKIQIL